SNDRGSRPYLEELKRHLHTLKGGARMAGISAMGNLSHEVETLLTSIDDGRVRATENVDEALQQSIDELHRMRDSVTAGKTVAPAAHLEDRIRALSSGGTVSIEDEDGESLTGDRRESAIADFTEFSSEAPESVSMVIVDETEEGERTEPGEAAELEQDDAAELEQDGAAELEQEQDAAAGLEQEEFADLSNVVNIDEESQPSQDNVYEASFIDSDDEAMEAEQDADLRLELEEPAESTEEDDRLVTDSQSDARDESDEETPEESGISSVPEADHEEPAETLAANDEQTPAEPTQDEAMPLADEVGARRLMRLKEEVAAQANERSASGQRQEIARIDADLLEDLLNAAGEISIYHSRLSQQISTIEFHVEELEQTVTRLREQLRKLEMETEAQIMHRHQDTLAEKDFDPLEMDRYSNIQQLSRALAESASDMASLKELLRNTTSDAETLLVQQSRVTAELQDGLMRTRMVPFERHVPRLTRLARQVATETEKRAELAVEGASGELDRQVLDKMLAPFEHMVRNAVIHGIELPQVRQAAGKPATGRITVRLHREGAEMVIDVSDDGAGLDVDAIRRKAFERELLRPDSKVSDTEIMQLILTPGFSTAKEVTQSAGRGVGMDVVANEVKQLGGSLQISSVIGQGTNFTIRLPFTLAITQALIVRAGDEVYALPLPTVEGVSRVARHQLEEMLQQADPVYEYGEQTYHFRHLGMYLGGQAAQLPEDDSHIPVILVRAGDHAIALLTDEMIASQEIVVKSLGPQLSSIRGISGATILGDGRIVLILDINALVRAGMPIVEVHSATPAATDQRPLALVVDDSITVRRVMERFLTRNGMRVATAKDGMDAISVLRDTVPDIILLDIEMPRMDGYEFATHVRNDERVSDVPIIMITSRVGDKHRARAIEIGVNDYLGKPYQDSQLLDAIARLLQDRGIEPG
ncbi:MAG: response regulator, partial [Woeseia sp.]|nr:response regulator [Woeseia sp.]NNL55494.1 response regulator [Woeseia sp.]